MQVDLYHLLRHRTVKHPSQITGAWWRGSDFNLTVTGWPWWLDDQRSGQEGTINFLFEGVREGSIDPTDLDQDWDEALETFDVEEAATLPWARVEGSAFYCSAALPEPFSVYRVVHDLLVASKTYRRPENYLNMLYEGTLKDFVRITESASYLLGRFPPSFADAVRDELTKQGVRFTELPTKLEGGGSYVVTIGNSQFFCAEASATFN